MIKTVALLVLGLTCLSSLVMAASNEYTITAAAGSDGTYKASGASQLQVSVKLKTVASGSTRSGVVSTGTDYVSLDVSLLQALGVSLSAINLQAPEGTSKYTFYGSNSADDIGTELTTGTSISALTSNTAVHLNKDGWPAPAGSEVAYPFISITCDGNIKLTIIIIIVVCEPCSTTTTTTARPTGPAGPGGNGDPQFNGLQRQSFQFHGMADEVFSVVSSPELRVNSLFKYISSGSCDYNDTVCWTHPGTYLDQIGMSFGNDKVLLKSGSHSAGMKVYVNDKEIVPSTKIHHLESRNTSATIKFTKASVLVFESDVIYMRIINSDYFFNFDFGLKDSAILVAGAVPLAITGEICELENRAPLTQDMKSQIKKKLADTYPAYPLHGLVGQTWRNAIYCGRYFEGQVDDYVTGDLFANPPTFSYFNY